MVDRIPIGDSTFTQAYLSLGIMIATLVAYQSAAKKRGDVRRDEKVNVLILLDMD